MELSLLILECIHKSYISFTWKYMLCHIFIFLVMEKSWKIDVEKEGAP